MAEKTKKSNPSKKGNAWWKNRFYTVLIAVALIGGGCAFFIPPFITSYGPGDNVPGLRQAFLAITGGTLAILTLWETRRKNDQEHMRQVHAERRSRYAKAVEQLADEKAPIRLGGVYTLIKLVDDWLDDAKTLPSMEKRRQEGQIIIDSLCAYIRSSFSLAERHDELTLSYEEYLQKCQDNQGKNQATQSVENSADNSTPKAEEHQDNKQSRKEFVRDKSLFREEQEVRQTILSEIKKRLNSGEVKRDDGKYEIKPGTWSYFEYDFLNTVFFYRVDFNKSYFGAPSNFSGVKFTEYARFSGVKFTKADFFEAEFTQNARFSGAEFTQNADFSWTEFTQNADFFRAKFTQNADFSEATFEEKPKFEYTLDNKIYKAKFSHKADPEGYNFKVSHDSPYKIETEEQEHNGVKFIIPKGTELFDPDDPSN